MPLNRETENKSPHVMHIVKTLQDRIQAGKYADGHWLPPERTLCEEFQVSRATLRLALLELEQRSLLRRAPGCRPLVQRRQPTVEDHRAITIRRSIGLCVKHDPKFSGTFLLTQGAQLAADSDTLRLVVGGTNAAVTLQGIAASEAQTLTRMVRDEDIAGIILWYSGMDVNRPALETIRAAHIPLVFVDRRPPEGFDADYVGIDNVRAAREAVLHLLVRGHTQIAHITNPEPVSAVYDRSEGYRQALESEGIALRPELTLMGCVEGMAEEGYRADDIVERLLALPNPPTALFAVTDYIGLAVVRALRARGLRVPEDMAVVGFDDQEQWWASEPFLTTVRQPFERVGSEAVNLLRRRMEAGASSASQHLLLDAQLIVRKSG